MPASGAVLAVGRQRRASQAGATVRAVSLVVSFSAGSVLGISRDKCRSFGNCFPESAGEGEEGSWHVVNGRLCGSVPAPHCSTHAQLLGSRETACRPPTPPPQSCCFLPALSCCNSLGPPGVWGLPPATTRPHRARA